MGSGPSVSPSTVLSEFVVQTSFDDLPAVVVHEAKRALINYFAVAFAGSNDPTIQKAAQVYRAFSANDQASLVGRCERTDVLNAAALNAMSANVYDFDDTHIPTIIHPTAPVAAALFALSEAQSISGRDFLTALIVGMELECRAGNAVSPFHYAKGWHITSTCGVLGSASAAARIYGLTARQVLWSFGIAVTQAGGLVECLGTMSKSVSVGNSARNGLLSALLASNNFNGPDKPLEGERGFVNVFGQNPTMDALTRDLGRVWEVCANTYKPYPCGVVLNPVLDACLAISQDPVFKLRGYQNVQQIQLTGHPLLRQRTDRPGVTTGRASQVSAQHAVAVALVRGKAGLSEFSDEAVGDETLRQLGTRLVFLDDEDRTVDGADVQITFVDGTVLRKSVDAAQGSLAQPLTDQALEQKLHNLREYGHVECNLDTLLEQLWALDALPDASVIMRSASGC